jgi:hypothetical protein
MDNKEDVQNSKHNKSQAGDIFVYLLGKNKNTVHKEAFPFFVFLLIIRPMFNEGMMYVIISHSLQYVQFL